MSAASNGRPALALGDHLLRAGNRLASPAGPAGRLSIAIFHRVLPQPDELFPDEVDRESFDRMCGWFAAWFNVLPLDEAVQRLQRGALPERALAITFDDGYADNHEVALPVLAAHGLSATFFIATGYLDGGRMWNDTLIEAVRGCALPQLDLSGLGLPCAPVWPMGSAGARRSAIDALLPALKYLPPAERLAMVGRVAERARVELPPSPMMRSEQVRALAAAGMQIGAHTVSHPILARIDEAAALRELAESRQRLKDLLGADVTLFAYPNGRPGTDYGPRDVELARRCGFSAAVSTAPGAAGQGDDVFQLPRFTPWDRRRLRFGLQMTRNLLAARRPRS